MSNLENIDDEIKRKRFEMEMKERKKKLDKKSQKTEFINTIRKKLEKM